MKLIGVISTAVLSMTLGVAAPAYAWQTLAVGGSTRFWNCSRWPSPVSRTPIVGDGLHGLARFAPTSPSYSVLPDEGSTQAAVGALFVVLLPPRVQNLCISSGPEDPASLFSSFCQLPQSTRSCACSCRAPPPTATFQIIRTCSTIYKTHRLRASSGFLQVSISEEPLQNASIRLSVVEWALQVQSWNFTFLGHNFFQFRAWHAIRSSEAAVLAPFIDLPRKTPQLYNLCPNG
jgi:hypothetical protein